jgi:ferritin-like metal-binding protein YciE
MALKTVLIDELRDMYSAENQLVKALPKLAKGSKSPKLKSIFTAHLAETKGQVERLKKVFLELGEKPTGQHCNGMEGVIEEGKDALEKDEEGSSFEAGLIGAALRTEHYEIAGYEACIAMATALGRAKRSIQRRRAKRTSRRRLPISVLRPRRPKLFNMSERPYCGVSRVPQAVEESSHRNRKLERQFDQGAVGALSDLAKSAESRCAAFAGTQGNRVPF